MAKKININYESIEDILYMGSEERVKFSIDLALPSGDVVVDVGFDGMVKGIEVMNASDFFGIEAKELSRVKDGTLSVVYTPSYVSLSLALYRTGDIVLSHLVVPYSKKAALAA